MESSLRLNVVALPLSSQIRHKLLAAGFRTVDDLQNTSAVSLSKEAEISFDDALEVLKVSNLRPLLLWQRAGSVSALQLYEQQRRLKRIVTFCSELDTVLGGGVTLGQITEFCGVPGVGKTQIGIQLAVDVQIPQQYGGLGGAAVYIDTEGSFMLERVVDMAEAAVRHIHKLAERKQADSTQVEFTVEQIMTNIMYFRVHNHLEQVALVNVLEDVLQQHPQVRLVVLDSVSFHFRQDLRDMALRARLLARAAQQLTALAERRSIAVVLTNHVTTKVLANNESKLVPALGDTWGHAAATRVLLYWQEGERHAHVHKSPCLPPATARFTITADGVRGRRAEKRSLPPPRASGPQGTSSSLPAVQQGGGAWLGAPPQRPRLG